MKKALKITVISFAVLIGVIIILSLVVYFFLPGLPYYALAKYNFGSLDKEVVDCNYYDVKNTDTDSYKVDFDNFSVYIPDICVFIKQVGDNAIYKDDSTEFSIMADINFLDQSDFNLDKYMEGDSLKEAKLHDWFDSSGYEYPKTFFDCNKMSYSLTSKDFDITDRKQSILCFTFASYKECIMNEDMTYNYYERGNIKGFVTCSNNYWSLEFFITDDLTKSYLITAGKDKDFAYKVFNSIEFK